MRLCDGHSLLPVRGFQAGLTCCWDVAVAHPHDNHGERLIYLAALAYLVAQAGSLATECKLLAAACGILAPRPGIEPTL